MAASYPSGTKAFTTKTDGPGQTIFAAHVNDIQDEVVAVENALLTGFAHALKAISGTNALPGVGVGAANVGVYSSGANALDLATAGVKALGIDSTQFIDSPTQPRASAYNSAVQSLTSGVTAVVTLNSEDYDVGSMHDNVTNNSRITIPTGGDGLYYIVATISFDANATGFRQVQLLKNGATLRNGINPGTAAAAQTVVVAEIAVLAAADYIQVDATQTSGGALNIGNATRYAGCSLQVVKLW